MGNFNKVFLMGNITRDIDLRSLPSGSYVAGLGMAINRNWKGKDGQDKKEACFVDINFFGKTAEIIAKYFSKGDPIFIEGRLKFEQWENKEGQKVNKLKVTGESFQFIGGKKGSNEGPNSPWGSNAPDVSEEDIPF